ncbi:hypothetical protein FKK06_10865, partial [Klebsiella pneumoniae]|nr:hypothetical protein [Klebsiella pneumoniae]
SAQIREILISESAWEEMTCLFAPSLGLLIGPTKSSVVFALPITRPPSQDKTTHNISHNPFTLRPRPRPEG